MDRVISRIKINQETGCHEWTGCVDDFGYGCARVNSVNWRVHRYAWTQKNGPIEKGKCLLHSCDNPRCMNVQHLRVGTRDENMKDMHAKKRNRQPRGQAQVFSKFTDEDVLRIREACRFGARAIDLATAWGVAPTHITSVKNRRCWKHI